MKKIYLTLLIVLSFSSGKLSAQCATASATPYYENFEGITAVNQLPTCWTVSNPGTCLTFTNGGFSGNKFAAFYYSPSGDNYFYSMAIQLNAGITYSASAWYVVSFNSNITWTDLSMFVGPNQSTTGLVPIASTNGNVTNTFYTALTNTFTVATSGVYYIAMRGTSNGSVSGSQYLSWDDLSVTVPCTPAFNTPSLTLALSSNSACVGSVITVTASGAHIYNGGSSVITITVTNASGPGGSAITVIGTNTLTGCTKQASVAIQVLPTPSVLLFTNATSVCKGSSAILTAAGASSYTWSDASTGSTLIATPTVLTTYTVVGAAANGCTNSAVQAIGVFPLPVVTVTSSATGTLCSGEEVTLTGGGAGTYQWNSNASTLTGSTITFTSGTTITFTVSGTDANGCVGKAVQVTNVDGCTGLSRKGREVFPVKIYPNPGNGLYSIEASGEELRSIEVSDAMGRIVFCSKGLTDKTEINLNELSNGIYTVKIFLISGINYKKIVKE